MSRRRRGRRPSFLPAPSSDVVVLCGNGIGGGGGGKGDLHYLLLSAEGGSGRFDLNFENFMGDDDGGDLRGGGDGGRRSLIHFEKWRRETSWEEI